MTTRVGPQLGGQPMAGSDVSSVRIVAIAIVATLGGFLFGYDTAVINGTVGALSTEFQAGSW